MCLKFNKKIAKIAILWGLVWYYGCDQSLIRNDLEAIKERGEIVMITRNNAACYFEGPDGPTGFEYDLTKAFADQLGVRLKTIVIEDEASMVAALREGKADLIASDTPFGPLASRMLALGPGYMTIEHQVVGRRNGPEIKSVHDLMSNVIWLSGNSSRLWALKEAQKKHPQITWQTLSDYSAEEMLQMVWNESLPLTILESNIIKMNRRFYPELVVHLNLGSPRSLTWAMAPGSRGLQKAVSDWFVQASTQEKLQGLKDHYFSHLEEFDYVDLARYRRRISDRLPKYQAHFEQAAEKYGLDWRLVAAQAYQESHWNPRARSYTGVRGIMMLTQETAKTLGLKNRLEVKETIWAGTRYLARLHRLIGGDVPEPDRTLMALAAYNIGFGHLQDARELARRLNKQADTWHCVRSVLPLLQKQKYYKTLTHGYARGNEAVQYVDRIRTYHKVLDMTLAMPGEMKNIGG
jgi:membrane-bound lytic murein transglycosylase F